MKVLKSAVLLGMCATLSFEAFADEIRIVDTIFSSTTTPKVEAKGETPASEEATASSFGIGLGYGYDLTSKGDLTVLGQGSYLQETTPVTGQDKDKKDQKFSVAGGVRKKFSNDTMVSPFLAAMVDYSRDSSTDASETEVVTNSVNVTGEFGLRLELDRFMVDLTLPGLNGALYSATSTKPKEGDEVEGVSKTNLSLKNNKSLAQAVKVSVGVYL